LFDCGFRHPYTFQGTIAMRIGPSSFGFNLTALSSLLKATNNMALITQQLATGSMLNRGSDNPAGLIAAAQISNELSAVDAAGRNAENAHNMLNVADSAMAQVNGLLQTIQSDIVSASGDTLSPAQKQAKQVEINAAIQGINAIGANTSLGGQKLLDGHTITFNFSPAPGGTTKLALPDVNSESLGGAAGKLSDLAAGGSANVVNGDLSKAAQIVSSAVTQIAQDRAQLGAFDKYVVGTSSAVLDAMQLSLSSSLSQIADTDMAQSTSLLVRDKILAQATLKALVIANHSRGMVLQLLGGNNGNG
jgi:flagellin-like hook-associated protein FlgL